MTKSAADAEAEVEASRNNLDRTMEALKDKMTPGQLFDEASRAMGASGQQIVSKFMEQARENPMPLAVMGLGLAWLMTSSRRDGGYAGGEGRSFAPHVGRGLSEAAHNLGERAGDLASGARDRLSEARTSLEDRAHGAADGLSAAASSAMDRAGDYRQRAQQGFSHLLESEPLVIGALGLVVGAAIGASLPHTAVEDRAVGPLRDRVLEKGKTLAQETLNTASDVTEAVYHGVKDELAAQKDGEAGLAERAEAVARSAVQAGQAAVGQTPPQGPAD